MPETTITRSHRGRSSEVHRRLRQETAGVHAALERELDLLGEDLTLARYRRVVEALFGFLAPLESPLERTVAAAPPPFALGGAVERLERDLVALGTSHDMTATLPRCAYVPRFQGIEQAAGCLYVLEGAALGGQIIVPAVAARLGVGPANGAAYFAGTGPDTGSRWKQVLGWLDRTAQTGGRADEIVAAAIETFLALRRWMADRGAAR